MLLGYSTYFTTLVRSSADPSVDMFNVDNPVSLVGYLAREQYGDWPILYGQEFTAQPEDTKITETYIKSNGKYEKNTCSHACGIKATTRAMLIIMQDGWVLEKTSKGPGKDRLP